ncbi:hypothetical protein [Sulfurimonas sp.]|nr:hypothetical protein [Sulfurimonas sp.]
MFDDILIMPAVLVVIGASFFFLISSLIGILSDGILGESKIT